jgi:hypothetical protein
MLPGEWPVVTSLEQLASHYRIEYCAPGDARNTGLPDGSVSFIYSSSTLEHIPEREIRAILTECIRVSSPAAVMSFIIDYHDHFGTADRNITRWNFYRYDEAQWRKYNPGNHYQNRLRHSDHQRLFAELGLQALIDRRVQPDWAASELKRTSVCETFRHYSQEDLMTANGHFLLRPPSSRPATAQPTSTLAKHTAEISG